jgi:hypothetical protein
VAGRDGRQPGSPASHGRITDRATALDTAAPDGHAAWTCDPVDTHPGGRACERNGELCTPVHSSVLHSAAKASCFTAHEINDAIRRTLDG